MKNKGFTLVELLAVIVILALLLAVAVPSIIGVSNKVKDNMYCSKIKDIERAANLYGNDYVDEFNSNYKFVSICELLNSGVYKKEGGKKDDNGNDIKKCYCEVKDILKDKPKSSWTAEERKQHDNACVTDPRDGSSMDELGVRIKIVNKRIYSEYVGNATEAEINAIKDTCK